ncbi:NAD(+) diphosphatase [Insolitispirillum peregrinum]
MMSDASFARQPGRPAFTVEALDRSATMRKSPDRLLAAWADPRSRVIVCWRDQHLMTPDRQTVQTVEVRHPLVSDTEPLFLGLLDGVPHFAVQLRSGDEPPPVAGGVWDSLRTVGLLAPADIAGVAAMAQGLFHWHLRHRFCGLCGAPTSHEEGGHLRRCSNPACAAPHFPRTDPAVIMLVSDGPDRILLGRQAAWAPGMMSTLAGFVEPGETLEQAVAREVLEEVGLQVRNVRYFASQPWPFPASLMLGFIAEAASTEIRIDQDELESARWFTRDELRSFRDSPQAEGDGYAFPSPISISRALINHWLASVG